MRTLVEERLTQELLDVLDVLLVHDLGQHSQSVRLEEVVVVGLHIFGEAGDDDEDLGVAHVQLLDEDVDESPHVLVVLAPLRVWHLEQLGHVEEHLGLLVLSELDPLVEEEDDLVEEVDAFLLLESLVVEDVRFLDESGLVEA